MIRFLADACLNHSIVSGCLRREPAIDFASAHSAGLAGLSDARVLEIAATQGRILVTHDFQTMPEHFAGFLKTHNSSPGVFLVKQRTPVRDVIEAIVLIWAASEEEDWKNRIVEVPL